MAPTQHLVRLGSFFKSIGFVHVNSKRAGTAPGVQSTLARQLVELLKNPAE